MRSKKLIRQFKKAFEGDLQEETLSELASFVQCLPEGAERDALVGLLEGLPSLFEQVEQTYQQNDERVEMAQRNLEVSSKELTEVNGYLFSLNQTFDAMVNSLGQGFFLFGRDHTCLNVYSKVCESLLETSPSGKCVADVLRIPAEKQLSFLDWCSMLFEEIMEFEELACLGPKFFTHSAQKVITLEFKPVRNAEGKLDAVVVIATDRTKEYEASKKARDLQAYATLVVSILKDRPRFSQFVRHSRMFFTEIRTMLKESRLTEEAAMTIKRHLHTLKGAAATFGMEQIKEQTHNIETEIGNQYGLVALHQFLSKSVAELENLFEHLLQENKEIIGDIFQGGAATREVTVACLESFALKLKDFGAEEKLYQSFVQGILCVPLWENFSQFNAVVEATAAVTRKKVSPVGCLGDNPPVYPEAYEHVWESLSHLFRNLVDHGIESCSVRKALGKSEAGQIFIRCRELQVHGQRKIELQISDDGQGINPETIRQRLIQKNLPEASSLSTQELLNKIFEPGFSTAMTVTEISGRGVGMDIVKSSVDALGGHVGVESVVGKGTTFTIILPLIQAPELKNVGKPSAVSSSAA